MMNLKLAFWIKQVYAYMEPYKSPFLDVKCLSRLPILKGPLHPYLSTHDGVAIIQHFLEQSDSLPRTRMGHQSL